MKQKRVKSEMCMRAYVGIRGSGVLIAVLYDGYASMRFDIF